jgi:hypothetical protein
LTHEQAEDKIRHVHAILQAAWGATPSNMQMIVLRSDSAITFVSPWPRRHVQIVLRRYRSVAEVIAGFDIDACSLAFDGARVLALPRSQRALNCAYNLVDPSRRSPTYEMRLYKYAMRGFSVLVPAFDAKVHLYTVAVTGGGPVGGDVSPGIGVTSLLAMLHGAAGVPLTSNL